MSDAPAPERRGRARAGSAGPTLRRVPAVTRAAAILRLLGHAEAPLPLSAVARSLDLVPSTALHILRALAGEGLVAVDGDTKRYRLGPGILAIARSALRHDGFGRRVQPALDALAQRHGVTAIGVEVIGLDHMVVLAIAHADLGMRLHVELGSRFPALISATGRCLAAFGGHPWSALKRGFQALRWHRAPSLAQWQADIEATRRQGYGVDEGSYIEGVTIVGVPVLGADGRMTHGLVAIAVAEQMRRLGVPAIAAALQAAVREVSEPG